MYYDNNFNNNGNFYNGGNNGGYIPPQYVFNQNVQMPKSQPSLNREELELLKREPINELDINITEAEHVASECNHITDNPETVRQLNDGSGLVYCTGCHEVWDPNLIPEEEVEEMVSKIISAMQNTKWVGNLPTTLIRDYFTIIPLLKKFPKLYNIALKNADRFNRSNYYGTANENAAYNEFDSLFANPMMGQMQYGNQFMGQPYGGQQFNQFVQQPYGGQQFNQFNGGQQYGAPASNVNPMQAGNVPYGAGQQYSSQFVNQANNMLYDPNRQQQAVAYGNQQVQGYGYNPNPTQQITTNAQQPQQAPAGNTVTEENKSVDNGEQTSTVSVNLK